MAAEIHLLKLSVGTESVADLAAWQRQRSQTRREAGQDDRPRHVTRMWPKRAETLLAGGSIYWVIKGLVLARQIIAELQPQTGDDGITRCAIILTPRLIRTTPQPRRPFQGWRYLRPEDAPADLGKAEADDLPPRLMVELSAIGVR